MITLDESRTKGYLPLILLFLFVSCFNCQQDQSYLHTILFLSHTYISNDRIDPRIEELPLSSYDHIWLGGDICANTDAKMSTLKYVDDLFQVAAPQNYWALGNHDVVFNNYQKISQVTGKPDFYVRQHHGMTVLVLNTNLEASACEKMEAQYELFQAVCDTIRQSSHLVILAHHVIWNHVQGTPNLWQRANANHPFYNFLCDRRSRFEDGMYDSLVEVQRRGVKVLFISGDYGQKEKFFQHQTAAGIWLLATGIDHSNQFMGNPQAEDRILILQHDTKERSLNWQFLKLDSLLRH